MMKDETKIAPIFGSRRGTKFGLAGIICGTLAMVLFYFTPLPLSSATGLMFRSALPLSALAAILGVAAICSSQRHLVLGIAGILTALPVLVVVLLVLWQR